MQEPKPGAYDTLGQTTQLYCDLHVSLELLHMPYNEYIVRVPRLERLANQLYLMLKNAKDEYHHEQMQQQAEMERQAQQGTGMMGRA